MKHRLLVTGILLLMLCMSMNVHAYKIAGGYFEWIDWELSEAGILTLSGWGSMSHWSSYKEVPWYDYRLSIKQVYIKEGVSNIGNYAFYGCSAMTSVTIPNTITNVQTYAFYGCSSLTSVKIPEYVTTIGDGAFFGCTHLTTINIPYSVRSIGATAFWNCSSLTRVDISGLSTWCKIDFGHTSSNPLYYGAKLYLNGEEIKTLIIPNSVTSIKDDAFVGCSSLTSVTIPNTVTSIGKTAFEACKNLTSVIIPNSVKTIGIEAFYACWNLASVRVEAEEPPIVVSSNTFMNVEDYAILYVPKRAENAYRAADVWKRFKNIQTFCYRHDVNSDGLTDVGDITSMITAIMGQSSDSKFDVNGDGNINVGDLTEVVNAIMNN